MREVYFELKEEHIKLLSNMYVSESEGYSGYIVPTIDQKRPYGNSYVIGDICEILEGKEIDEDKLNEQGVSLDDFEIHLNDKYKSLHEETVTALQIILHTKSFVPGLYKLTGYGKEWELINS